MAFRVARASRLAARASRCHPAALRPHPPLSAVRPLIADSRPCIRLPQSLRWSSTQAETTKYTFEDLRARLDSPSNRPLVVIDVREPKELEQTGSIPGARNLPVSTLPSHLFLPADEFEDALGWPKPASGDEVVFYCKAGVRSRAAAAMVREEWSRHGVQIGEYPGSWLDWEKQGGKIEKR